MPIFHGSNPDHQDMVKVKHALMRQNKSKLIGLGPQWRLIGLVGFQRVDLELLHEILVVFIGDPYHYHVFF